jgi:lambda family phage portal protein
MKEVKEQQKMTLSDRLENLVALFSPKLALQRRMYRSAYIQASSYRGADKSRLRKSWNPGAGSPDEDLLYDLVDLRTRSRDLNRNDAHASGITGTMVTNVIGSGIRPQSRVDRASLLDIPTETLDLFQEKAERAWQKWTPFADAGNRLDFYEIQQLVERQMLENGDVFIIPLMTADSRKPYQLSVEIIEADRVDTPSDLRSNKNVRGGVEIGPHGEPVAYFVRRSHPGDLQFQKSFSNNSENYVRYPAFNELGRPNVLHLYALKRPGQTRGEPFFAPVMNYFKDLADYMEAELVSARVAACFAAFIKKTDPYNAAIGRGNQTNDKGQRLESIEPGMIEYLSPGEEVSQVSPNRPGGTFDPFVERILRAISAGLNLPYEVVAKDFSKSNYSSARAALLEARRYFRVRQEFIAKRLCQPIWDMLLEEAYLVGELPIVNFYENRLDIVRAKWISPGWGWVDPTKEVQAARDSIDGNLSTLADEAAALGKDWEEVLEQRAREQKKLKDLGLENKPLIKNNPLQPGGMPADPSADPNADPNADPSMDPNMDQENQDDAIPADQVKRRR